MVGTAMFYGIEQSTPAQDVFLSFIISVIGTVPVLIVRINDVPQIQDDDEDADDMDIDLELTQFPFGNKRE